MSTINMLFVGQVQIVDKATESDMSKSISAVNDPISEVRKAFGVATAHTPRLNTRVPVQLVDNPTESSMSMEGE